jgi:hypothetical protein
MSRLPVTSLEIAFGLPVTSLEVIRQSLEVSQVLTSVVFHAWVHQTYTHRGLDHPNFP